MLLGAGNAAFLVSGDVLHQLFIADRVVLLKLNPVNAYLSPWGAYPGRDCCDVQSGIGMANNALMLADAQKSVYRAPFHKLVDPYTLQSRRIVEFGRRFAAYDGSNSLAKFASLLWTSLRC